MNSNNRTAATLFPRDIVCLRNISINTLHKGDDDDDDHDDDNDNNNNNNNNTRNGDHSVQETERNKLKMKIRRTRKETDERIRPYRWSGTKAGCLL